MMDKVTKLGLLLAAVPFASLAQATNTIVYDAPGNYTWTVPAGVTNVSFELWGAGGAGGSGKVVSGTHYPGMGGGASTPAVSDNELHKDALRHLNLSKCFEISDSQIKTSCEAAVNAGLAFREK